MAYVLTKATIYLGKNLFGTASKIVAPEIDAETTEQKNGFGAYNLPIGIKAMTSSITLTGFDVDVFNKISNPLAEINMTIYASLDEFNNETLSNSKPVKLVMRGSSQKFSLLGELEQQKNIEYPVDFNISAAKLFINNQEKYNIDIPNLIWKVNGVDLMAKVKKNLALS